MSARIPDDAPKGTPTPPDDDTSPSRRDLVVDVYEPQDGSTGGASFHYLMERRELVHLSKYAVHEIVSSTGIRYQVPLRIARDRTVYQFQISRTGDPMVATAHLDDLNEGRTAQRMPGDSWKRALEGVRFRVEEAGIAALHQEYLRLVDPMAVQVSAYAQRHGLTISPTRSRRVDRVAQDPVQWYFSAFCSPDPAVRRRMANDTRRRVYLLWVLKELCEAWDVIRFLSRPLADGPVWSLERGTDTSALIAETPREALTVWHGFGGRPGERVPGTTFEPRAKVDPDWVTVRGSHTRKSDLDVATHGFETVVICQDAPYPEWADDVARRIEPTHRALHPRRFILASLHPIPSEVRHGIQKRGIAVLDDFGPHNQSVTQLRGRIAAGAPRELYGP